MQATTIAVMIVGRDCMKINNYTESNTEKKQLINVLNQHQKKISKEVKNKNLCYPKDEKAITKWGAIEKI